jgi:Cu/Ag efflux protein CusF
MSRFPTLAVLAVGLGVFASPETSQAASPGGPAVLLAQAVALTEGEVRKVDRDGGKLTLRHAEIKKFDMPGGMTMVFQTSSPTMLEGLAVGDKVMFDVEKLGGAMTITELKKN